MQEETFDELKAKLLAHVNKHKNGNTSPPEPPPEPPSAKPPSTSARFLPPMDVWKVRVAKIIEADCEKAGNLTYENTKPEELIDSATNWALTVIRESGLYPPDSTDIEQEVRNIASGVVQGYLDRYEPQLPDAPSPAREFVIAETAEQAELSNAAYLSREAIVEGLDYECATSLIVGGKHEGKTTIVRSMALAVAGGEPIFGRATVQTPVIYAASDDEYATTRMELLRMGWLQRRLPLVLVRVKTQDSPEPEQVLEQLARFAEREGSRYVVLDMLFDFIRVQDENRYAQTRQAIGHIQTLADTINGHVKPTHHTPKWIPDIASAAKAALGSQGIAARFSPIMLAKKWSDDLFTLESTMTRDPRGRPIKPICVIRNEFGWACAGGEFKAWMKWRMYVDRIIALFEGDEGKQMSVREVSEAIDVSKHETGNALLQMFKAEMLDRRRGRGTTFIYSIRQPNLLDGLTGDPPAG